MKSKLFLICSVCLLMAFTCEDDDSGDDGDSNPNYIEYLGVRYEGNIVTGGCNIEDVQSGIINCTYVGGFFGDTMNYTFSVYHFGTCRSGTFNMLGFGDLDIDDAFSGDAAFTMVATEDGVTVESFEGISGSIELVDNGANSSMLFSGEVQSLTTGAITEIEGFVMCTTPILN